MEMPTSTGAVVTILILPIFGKVHTAACRRPQLDSA
jgi:hypothetical protein